MRQIQYRMLQAPQPHCNPLFLGYFVKFFSGKNPGDFSILYKYSPVNQVHQKVNPMFRHNDCPSFLFYLDNLLTQNVNCVCIQISRWFIQNKNRRIHGINARKSKALFFTARHGKNIPAKK